MTSLVNTETGEIAATVNYDIHPAATLFPLIEGDAFRALVEDIRVRGQEVPVVLDRDGRLLDGRNRARACAALGIDVTETRYEGDDPFGFVISHNMHRRHLTESQRAMVAAKLVTFKRGDNRFTVVEAPIGASTQREAATALSVSRNSVQRATKVRDHGTPEMQEAVEAGRLTVNRAAELIDAALKKAAPPPPIPSKQIPRQEKADVIADLAEQGYSSRQIAPRVGVTDIVVRSIAREYDIQIPADLVVGKARRIDHTDVVEKTVIGLENTAEFIEAHIDLNEVDFMEADEWVSSLSKSISALTRFRNQIKEKTHV